MKLRVVAATVALPLLFLAFALSAAAQSSDGIETISAEQLRLTGALHLGPALSLSRPDLFSATDSATLVRGLPISTLLHGRSFRFSRGPGLSNAAQDIPLAFLSAVDRARPPGSVRHSAEAAGGALDSRLNRLETGGEVGFFYGKSSGRYGREDMGAYIIGGVGNEHFQITAGAAYSESSGRIPVRSR